MSTTQSSDECLDAEAAIPCASGRRDPIGHEKSACVDMELTVERYLSGIRIDAFLIRHFRNYTSFRMQRMVRAGMVSIDGGVVDLDCRVFGGQRVRVRLIEPPDKLIEPESIPLTIVYEDAWIVVINKPDGLIAHPVGRRQSGSLSNALQFRLDGQTVHRGLARPGIVHRLDRMTSGLIVTTRDHMSHRQLSIAFQNGRVSKSYAAVVEGVMPQRSGTIRLPIGRAPGRNSVLMSAKSNARDARPAQTNYKVIRSTNQRTLLRATPLTGRNHQIRVHLAEIGYPIVGDAWYRAGGRVRAIDDEADIDDLPRHALHAQRLEFAHPVTHEWMRFESAIPDDMLAMFAGDL